MLNYISYIQIKSYLNDIDESNFFLLTDDEFKLGLLIFFLEKELNYILLC